MFDVPKTLNRDAEIYTSLTGYIRIPFPRAARFAFLRLVGGGGGGGAGCSGTTAANRGGGAGGTSAWIATCFLPLDFVPNGLFLLTGAGGVGAVAVTNANGGTGSNGGASVLTGVPGASGGSECRIVATGGNGGGGGTTSAGGTVSGNNSVTQYYMGGLVVSTSGTYAGGNGAYGGNGTNMSIENSYRVGAGAGGGGSNTVQAFSGGGQHWSSNSQFFSQNIAAGPGVAGLSGSDGFWYPRLHLSTGGCGGASAFTSIPGGSGGNGVMGSGGGGGGSSIETQPSGAGGKGGDGFCAIWWF